jgi:hypothetical protein
VVCSGEEKDCVESGAGGSVRNRVGSEEGFTERSEESQNLSSIRASWGGLWIDLDICDSDGRWKEAIIVYCLVPGLGGIRGILLGSGKTDS